MLALRDTLELSMEQLALGRPEAPNALEQTRAAGQQLQRLCALEPDMMLAVAQRLRGGRYCVRHSIATACVLEFTLARLGTSPGERRTAVMAALTMNLGMFELQETLCDDIAARLLSHPSVRAVRVSTCKPDVYPDCEAVGVEVFRIKAAHES